MPSAPLPSHNLNRFGVQSYHQASSPLDRSRIILNHMIPGNNRAEQAEYMANFLPVGVGFVQLPFMCATGGGHRSLSPIVILSLELVYQLPFMCATGGHRSSCCRCSLLWRPGLAAQRGTVCGTSRRRMSTTSDRKRVVTERSRDTLRY